MRCRNGISDITQIDTHEQTQPGFHSCLRDQGSSFLPGSPLRSGSAQMESRHFLERDCPVWMVHDLSYFPLWLDVNLFSVPTHSHRQLD